MRNFQDTFETRKRSFISVFSICMTAPLRVSSVSLSKFAENFSRIWTEYGEIQSISPYRISPYSVRMREDTDQKHSEYEHFSRSVRTLSNINNGGFSRK